MADVFYFQDRLGVIHFSNVPADPRFKPFRGDLIDRIPPEKLAGLIQTAGHKTGIDPDFIRAVIKVESDFDRRAVSKSGAMGLMQLMPATAEQYGVTDPFDTHQNVLAGSRHLRYLSDRFAGDIRLVLAAYHAGPERVDRARGQVPPIVATKHYITKVLAAYGKYRKAGASGREIYVVSGPGGEPIYTNVPEQYLPSIRGRTPYNR